MGRERSAFHHGQEASLQQRPHTFAQTNPVLLFFACKQAADHTFRMGWELLRSEADVSPQAQPGGIFNFGGTYAPLNPAVPNGTAGITPNTGNDFAAFLLGSVTKATFSTDLAIWLARWTSNA